MASSLFGIYNASRSMMVNQAALNLINNNIANMNTPGYSKQRLELSQNTIVTVDANNPYIAAQTGSGVSIDAISRSRDAYLDAYFQHETTKQANFKEMNQNVVLLEDITNELSDKGIGKSFSDFYDAVQKLSNSPTDSVTRTGFTQRAIDVANKFNQISSQLSQLKSSLIGNGTPESVNSSKLNLVLTDLNETLKNVADLNKTISFSTSQGVTPNGLLDDRDKLLDKLSQFMPVTVTTGSNNVVNISLGNTLLVSGSNKIGDFKMEANTNPIPPTGKYDPVIVNFVDNNGVKTDMVSSLTSGQINGVLDFVRLEKQEITTKDADGNDVVTSIATDKLSVSNVQEKLDLLARTFAKQINDIQNNGKYIDKTITTPSDPADPKMKLATAFDIFVQDAGLQSADETLITASNITVSNEIIKDSFKIAAAKKDAGDDDTGNGGNALLMAQSRNTNVALIEGTTVEGFMNSTVGKIGVQSKSIKNSLDTQNAILDQLKIRREAASGVNLDEELTDLIKYQRSYEASAKIFSAVDKIIQQIISLAG